jgi:hypothetical protein
MQVMLKNVRLAFPNLFEARGVGDSDPRYSATLIFAVDSPAHKQMVEAIEKVAKDKWGAKAEVSMKTVRAKNKVCLHDGAEKARYDGFDGMMYVSASNKDRPTVIDRQRAPLQPGDGLPYAGCVVNAQIDVWAQENQYGLGINALLMGIQFVKDGDRFGGGGVASADAFDILEDDEDASDLV